MDIVERFEGVEGRRRLVEAIRIQSLVCDDETLAEKLVAHGTIVMVETGSALVTQDAADSDLFLVVSGAFSVQVNGRDVARRVAGQHVGEMAVVDPRKRRAATLLALEQSVVLRVPEPVFDELAKSEPRLWRRVAMELADRLRQRNHLVELKRQTPEIFIGSSKESLEIARAVKLSLAHDPLVVRVWTDGVFGASHFPIDDLQAQLSASDFAVLVLGPDDQIASRGAVHDAPRDNVIFELGLFMGALGRYRSLMVRQRGLDLKIPSDLLGLTPLDYPPGPDSTLPARLALACDEIRRIVHTLGTR